ncbi:MAG: hypothetical protein HC925_04205 [Coleofasciculaceae cyanobacterium SM2_3_26]|nr:hypothetical protein [Coleofasciculaceae cyanobacterium SM2_3_26]
MNATESRQLGVVSLATLLVSAHYGLGFLLGTAEQATTLGFAGSLYAASIGLGTIVLLLGLARFYWHRVEPIWTLLGASYGRLVRVLVGVMAWTSLLGIEAVQAIAGAAILQVVGLPAIPSIVGLTLCFWVLSLLPVEKASWVFRGLLLLNVVALVGSLWKLHGFADYWRSPVDFFPALHQIEPGKAIGVSVCTVLLVLVDMKYHQYFVRAKDTRTLYLSCFLAGLMLLALAFLPSAAVIAAQHAAILPEAVNGRMVVPFILSWLGGGSDRPLGMLLVAALAVPALGLGSSVLRAQTRTVFDLELVPQSRLNTVLVAGANALLALAIALRGGSIIGSIASFYSAYVGAVWIPFAAYLIAQAGGYVFSTLSVRFSLIAGSVAALSALLLVLVVPDAAIFGSTELTIIFTGAGFGSLGLLLGQVIEKYVSLPQIKSES